jgi:hypothetical protein
MAPSVKNQKNPRLVGDCDLENQKTVHSKINFKDKRLKRAYPTLLTYMKMPRVAKNDATITGGNFHNIKRELKKVALGLNMPTIAAYYYNDCKEPASNTKKPVTHQLCLRK